MTIRRATAADLAAVERIEGELFPRPWKRDYFAAELGNPLAHFYAAEEPAVGAQTRLAGFLLFWDLGGVLELHRIAVAADRQRRGLGAQLLDFFIASACRLGGARAVLEVRESNAAAIALYASRGFRESGRRRGYYAQPLEDALLFELDLRRGRAGS